MRACKVDANQPEIVAILRDVGCSVTLLHAVGCGCPDLLVGFRGKNFLLEVKAGEKPPSKRKLTPDQVIWHNEWNGSKSVVKSPDEALRAIGMTING